MPLNVRGAVGWAVRAGCVAVAVVIAGSVVPAGTLEPLRYHRWMSQRGVMDRMAEVRSGRSSRALGVAVPGGGIVGREVVRSLLSGWEGPTFDLIGVAVRDLPKAEAAGMPHELLTDAPAHLVADDVERRAAPTVGGVAAGGEKRVGPRRAGAGGGGAGPARGPPRSGSRPPSWAAPRSCACSP